MMPFDEPTPALAAQPAGDLRKVMRGPAGGGRTPPALARAMGFARKLSSQPAFLHRGLVEERGNPREMPANPQSERLQPFLSGSLK